MTRFDLKASTEKYRTFFYGICTDDQITDIVAQAEEAGGILVAVIPGFMRPPQSAVALPGVSSSPLPILKVLVRMTETDYQTLLAKLPATSVNLGAH